MKKLLVFGLVWPEPKTTAAGKRMMQLLNYFSINSYNIYFFTSASKNDKSEDLEKLNIKTHKIALNNSKIDTYLTAINPDIVLFDRFLTEEQFGWRVSEKCPNAIKILDTEDLHFLRNAREIHQKNKIDSINHTILNSPITAREISSIYRCDFSLLISKYEFDLLTSLFGIKATQLLYLPFLERLIKNLSKYPKFKDRNHFISIGNFLHKPNLQSVIYLKKEIWPILKEKLPKAELHIYGAYAPPQIINFNNAKERFFIKGWASNLNTTFTNARVLLAPLLFGAGQKGKLIDSMKFGTPNVTTSIGAEGMHGNLDWNGFIEDDCKMFVKKAYELYTTKKVWKDSQDNGVAIINKLFDKDLFYSKLTCKIADFSKNINAYRTTNFIGKLLLTNNLNSYKYMSKWIEEKNKNKAKN